ncbi:MAG: cytochrome-c peroxidase [Candidatus Hydrogenedentota bacterium]
MGLRGDYFGDRDQEITDADYGRYNVTENAYDRHRFKTPTLRNVALSSPYMHDGAVETMEEAVDVMVEYMVDDDLSRDERDAILAFLESLTGELDGVPLDDEEAMREAAPEWRADHTQR